MELKSGFYFFINHSPYGTHNNPIYMGFSLYYYNAGNRSLYNWIGTGFRSDEKWIPNGNLISWLENHSGLFFSKVKIDDSYFYCDGIALIEQKLYDIFELKITMPDNYVLSAKDILNKLNEYNEYKD